MIISFLQERVIEASPMMASFKCGVRISECGI